MEKMKRCITCGLDMVDYVSLCPRCGSNRFVALQAYCPVCHQPIQGQGDHCPYCGTILSTQQPQMKPCPRCGAPLPVSASGCGRCGWSAMAQRPAQPQKKKTSLAWLWLFLLIPILVASVVLLGMLGGSDPGDFEMQSGPSTTTSSFFDWFNPPTTTATPPTSQTTVPTLPPTKPTQPPTKPTQPPTKPTQPPTKPTQPTTDTDSFPEELRDNLYLETKNSGGCEEMVGDVMVTIVFVSDPASSWDSKEIAEAKKQFDSDILQLEKNAASYGAELDLQITYLESVIAIEHNREDILQIWASLALRQHGIAEALDDQSTLEEHYGVDQAPIMFVLNRHGRSYACSVTGGKYGEYAVLFNDGVYPFSHELSHVFGAKDFYYPKEATEAAEKYLPGSVMMESESGEIDELTAYLIGWTDKLSPNAEAFLWATNHFTEDYLDQEHELETLTGFGTREYENGVYTGYMDLGIPHGEGTFAQHDGTVYTGNWVGGVREGYGELTTSTGFSYKGQWKDDVYHGKGTLHYASGDTYTGEFVEGLFQGKGTYTWSSGNIYEGDWVAGKRHGQGTMTWKDGSCYTGAWENDLQHGYGEYYYAKYNARYEGDFVEGKRHGWGTYYYADGRTYTGRWENDARVD